MNSLIIVVALVGALVMVVVALWGSGWSVAFVADCPVEGCPGKVDFMNHAGEVVTCEMCGTDIEVGPKGGTIEPVGGGL